MEKDKTNNGKNRHQNVVQQSARTTKAGQIVPEKFDQTISTFHHKLEELCLTSNINSWTLPSSSNLSPGQKEYLFSLVQAMDHLKIVSKEKSEALVVMKDDPTKNMISKFNVPFVRVLYLSDETKERIRKFLASFSRVNVTNPRDESLKPLIYKKVGALKPIKAEIPTKSSSNFEEYRKSLPIFQERENILEAIDTHQFTLIKGGTGAGKSTQIPQYILENANVLNTPVRILVCTPRRVSAVSLCDRIAQERGERVGNTVGYTIRLESLTSPCGIPLIFCTGPMLLHALASPGCVDLETTTHIILDEVHGRDRYTDLFFAAFRDVSRLLPHMKFIFMGEDIKLDFIPEYYADLGECAEVQIEEIVPFYPIKSLFLEDILSELSKNKVVDNLIENVFKSRNREYSINEFMDLVKNGRVDIDYRHSITTVTMLMAIAATSSTPSDYQWIRRIINSGANMNMKSVNGFTVVDWAKLGTSQKEVVDIIELLKSVQRCFPVEGDPNNNKTVPKDYYKSLEEYYDTIDLDFGTLDLQLIRDIVHHIVSSLDVDGVKSILIFLPGYEQMTSLKELLCHYSKENQHLVSEHFVVYLLHPLVPTGDQIVGECSIFEKPPHGMRKIILSTDIGESCMTCNDVGFIIDSGLCRKRYCASRASPLGVSKYSWISQDFANQRQKLAGKTFSDGVCFRLYTKESFNSCISESSEPEICHFPLPTLCLQIRSILGYDTRIAEFFKTFPQPPDDQTVESAVEHLKIIGALDQDEQLTDLGFHLLDYPVEPYLGKAILYSVIFKCIDPILTIVAAISYGESFKDEMHPLHSKAVHRSKVELSKGTLSDFLAILKAIQQWEDAKVYQEKENEEEKFCVNNHLSSSSLEIIYSIRSRLLGHLRAGGFVRTKGPSDVKDLNAYSENWAVVKGVLTASLYPNICTVNRITQSLFKDRMQSIHFHETSVIWNRNRETVKNLPSDWIIFEEMTAEVGEEKENLYLKGCTVVNSATVALFAGCAIEISTNSRTDPAPLVSANMEHCQTCMKIDDSVTLLSFDSSLSDIHVLRKKLDDTILRRLRRPTNCPKREDEALINLLVHVLCCEDERIGLKSINVGQWPKLVSGNLLSCPRAGFS